MTTKTVEERVEAINEFYKLTRIRIVFETDSRTHRFFVFSGDTQTHREFVAAFSPPATISLFA